MEYRAIAVVDDKIFDELIEFKSIMEQFDEYLGEIRFIHKENLLQEKASGDFLSAPLVFFLYDNLSKEEYNTAVDEAKILKQKYEIENCIVVFPSSTKKILSDNIKDTKYLDVERFSFVQSLHLIYEENAPKEDIPAKMLALLSGFLGNYIDEDDIAFEKDYVTATVEYNYDNFLISVLLSFEKIQKAVERINHDISECNEELEVLKNKKKKKYECKFSACAPISTTLTPDSIPKRTEDLLEYSKLLLSKANADYEYFSASAASDVYLAKHTLTQTFNKLDSSDEIDFDAITETEFSQEDVVTESSHLISRSIDTVVPSHTHFSALIPLYRIANACGRPTLKKMLTMFLVSLGIIGAALCAYFIPYLIRAGINAFTQDHRYIAVFSVVAVLVAFLTASVIEFVHNLKLRNYIKEVVEKHFEYYSNASKLHGDIRSYINKYVTVSINSYIKTKQIKNYLTRISDKKKQKKEYAEKTENLKRIEKVFSPLCEESFVDSDEFVTVEDLIKYAAAHSKTVNNSNVESPSIENNRWIKYIAFEST